MIKWHQKPGFQSLMIFSIVFLLFILIGLLLLPILVSLVLSSVLYILLGSWNHRLVRAGYGRNRAAGILLLVTFIIIGLPLAYLIPVVSSGLSGAAASVESAQTNIVELIYATSDVLTQRGFKIDAQHLVALIESEMSKFDQDTLISASNYLLGIAGSLFLVPFITFFLIRDFGSLRNKIMALLPNQYFELGWSIYFKIAAQLKMYVRSVIMQQSILALVASTGFFIAGYPVPLVLGIVVGVLGIIPYIGPALGLIPPIFIALGVDPFSTWFLLSAILVVVVAYSVDNLLVIPVLIAGAVNLHPLLVIVGIIIFGNALGIVGMIIAIPVLAVAKILYTELFIGLRSMRKRQVEIN